MSWRKLAKSEEFKDKFKPYKTDNKIELPNRAEFTGDKKPKSGDPAKNELNAWHSGNSLGKKDRKEEQKSNSSAVLNPKVKREDFNSQKKTSNWRNKLLKKAEVAFKQKPDGEVNISVTTPDMQNNELNIDSGNIQKEDPDNLDEEDHIKNMVEGKKLNWNFPKTHQDLMDSAYDLYQKPENENWTAEEFIQNLPSQAHKDAVILGNLNYQVENGGFSQWWGNGYGKRDARYLTNSLLPAIGTPIAFNVQNLISKSIRLNRRIEEKESDLNSGNFRSDAAYEEAEVDLQRLQEEEDELDSKYYAINEQFLDECESYLQRLLSKTSSKLNWSVPEKPSRAAYPEAHKIAKEIAELLGKKYPYIDPMTTGYRVSLGHILNEDKATVIERTQRKIDEAGYIGVKVRTGTGSVPEIANRLFAIVPYNINKSSKLNWREKFSAAEPDVQFKRKPDGTFELNVTHPQVESEENLPVLNTVPQQPVQTQASIEKESKDCSIPTKEWIIKEAKKDNQTYQLVGRECDKYAAIFIEKKIEGLLPRNAAKKKGSNIVDSEKIEKNGTTWQENINVPVWETKFEEFINGK